MTALAHILLFDDEPHLLKPLAKRLAMDGYVTTNCVTEEDAKALIRRGNIDIAILDVNLLPSIEIEKRKLLLRSAGQEPYVEEEGLGFRVAAWIKQHFPDVGIIMQSSQRTSEQDTILGLDDGADDYIEKCTSLDVILARIRSVMKRRRPQTADFLVFDDFYFDLQKEKITTKRGKEVKLTSAEFKLLRALASQPHVTMGRTHLYQQSFGCDMPSEHDRAVDNLVLKLRNKINDDNNAPLLIQGVRGKGYRFESNVRREKR